MLNGSTLDAATSFEARETFGATLAETNQQAALFGVPLAEIAERCMCPACAGMPLAADNGGPAAAVAFNGLPIYTWDEAAAQLSRPGRTWGPAIGQPATVTYSYRATNVDAPTDISQFSQFNAAQINATEKALQYWMDVANITFLRAGSGLAGPDVYSDNADVRFGNYGSGQAGAAAFAYYPPRAGLSASPVQGDVWINASLSYNANPVFFDYGPHVLLHEIGHAIGIAHPADYNATGDGQVTYQGNAIYFQDSRQYTVMSYFGSSNTGGSLPGFAAGPQMHDIAAAQRIYGPNLTTRTGDTIYGFNSNTGREYMTITGSNQGVVMALWDAGGNDTLDLSGYVQRALVDLREEALSSAGPGNGGGNAIGNIGIARGAVIENAITGAGSDVITGNAAANLLSAGAGADALDGGDGDDTLLGGAGADRLASSQGNDVFDGGADLDTVSFANAASGVSVNLAFVTPQQTNAGIDTLVNVERLEGSAFADLLIGATGDDTLSSGLGSDTMTGAGGNDVFGIGGFSVSGAPTGDVDVITDLSEGDQILFSRFATLRWDYDSDAQFVLLRSSEGQALRVPLAAFGGPNQVNLAFGVAAGTSVIIPIDAAHTPIASIIGALSTLGADTITGSAAMDLIQGFDGDDRISGEIGADALFGGAGLDSLTGGAGDDFLSGGAGADTLVGGAGNDMYWADAEDTIIEAAGEGIDTAFVVSNSFTITSPVLEGARFIGVGNFFAIGSEGDNILAGAAGADWAFGGLGHDTLEGGAGSDQLYGEAGLDRLFGGDGDDLIDGGADADSLEGGAGALDYLIGGGGNDTINGGDGADLLYGIDGFDTLNGGNGDDTGLGGDGGDILSGDAGGDTLLGEGGFDVVNGGAGNDVLWGGDEGDWLYGGDGIDWLIGQDGDDLLTGDGGVNVYVGGDGGDVMAAGNAFLAETQVFYAEAGNDRMTGSASTDWMFGAAGDDVMIGNAGSDMFFGGDGDDTIDFSEFGSTLASGDYAWGDAGNDTFISTARNTGVDVIMDFQAGAGGDALRLIGSPYASFQGVMDAAYEAGGYLIILLGGAEAVYLLGLTKAQMSADDFLFG